MTTIAPGPTEGDPRRSSFGLDYWLRRCQGFVVEAPNGRIGTVVETLYGPSAEPASLEVRAGLLGRRVLVLPAADVAEIQPERKRVLLRGTPSVLGTRGARDEPA